MTALRVAIVVPHAAVPAWVTRMIERLSNSELDVRLYVDPTRAGDWSRMYRAYEWIDARLFAGADDALARALLPGPAPQPLSALQQIDVAVHLGHTDPRDLADNVRYGVWRLEQRELFWEMYRGTTYRTTLEAHLPGGERRILYESRGRLDRTSLHRSRNQAYWKTTGAVLRELQRLQERGQAYLESRPLRSDTRPSHEDPVGATTVVRHAARVAFGVLARRLTKLVRREEWFVAARRIDTGGGFQRFKAAPGEDFADPFSIEHDGETYVFFERIEAGATRAAIACTRVDRSGRPLGPAQTVLAPAFHVSYPFVFRHGRDVYMIPESLENRTVDLYRAADFPSEWVLEARLLSGLRAVDATLLDHGSRLWLFLNLAEPGASINDELHLYTSRELAGPWLPHPENPVVSDVGRARPAGRIFQRNGALIRPAQDCSSGYGRAVVLNRIEVLTPTDYRETPIARLEPDWAPGLLGTHTYNSTGRLELVDGFHLASRR
jgi:hypothetical protein